MFGVLYRYSICIHIEKGKVWPCEMAWIWFSFCFFKLFLHFWVFVFKIRIGRSKSPQNLSERENSCLNYFPRRFSDFPGKFFLTNPKELSAAWFLGFAYFSLLVNNPFPVFRNFSVFCVIRSLSFFLVLLLLCIKFEALYQVWYFIRFVEFVSLVFSVLLELEWIIYCFEV
jgi:hypothetical protein